MAEKILVVEDELTLQETLAYNLKRQGYDVETVGDGPSALTAALILDRATLVRIYNATITKWNDPAIAALNPDLQTVLPDAKITVVHRSDGSGTTEIFT